MAKRILTKFQDEALIPDDAVAGNKIVLSGKSLYYDCDFTTVDGVLCSIKWMGTVNSESSSSVELLDSVCKELYGKDFAYIKFVWDNRGVFKDLKYWTLLRMERK